MKLSLSSNISRLRKEHSMTQEQLAEALGVTFASVSKWERGVATPELSLIAEMADLFAVSIDALIGYEFRNNDKNNVIARLKQYLHDRGKEDIYDDIEKSLIRYPNCFDVVYYSASIYQVRGICQNERSYLQKAISLYQRACALISQNTDSEISEISIYREMAETYIWLGEYDKGLNILKQHNPCSINHSIIGKTLAADCNDTENALPYLSDALVGMTQTYMEIAIGYLNVYHKTKRFDNALEITDLALTFLSGLINPDKPTYTDKIESTLWVIRAEIMLELNRKAEAAENLRRAKSIALQFDAAPNYDASNIRFVKLSKPATAYDGNGVTAMMSVENMVEQYEEKKLLELWRKVKDEE